MSWARRPFSMKSRRSRVALVLAEVAILGGLVLFEALLLSASTPAAKGVVSEVQIRIVGEGVTSGGVPWFGLQEINYTGAADGYPYDFTPGSVVNISIQPVNEDTVEHPINAVLVNSPFTVKGTFPSVPFNAEAHDDFLLQVSVEMPHSTGTYVIEISVIVGT